MSTSHEGSSSEELPAQSSDSALSDQAARDHGPVGKKGKGRQKRDRKRAKLRAELEAQKQLQATGSLVEGSSLEREIATSLAAQAVKAGTPGGTTIKHGPETVLASSPPGIKALDTLDEEAIKRGWTHSTPPPAITKAQSTDNLSHVQQAQVAVANGFRPADEWEATGDAKPDIKTGLSIETPWHGSKESRWIPSSDIMSTQKEKQRFTQRWDNIRGMIRNRGHIGYPCLRPEVTVKVQELPFEEFSKANLIALCQAYAEADFRCPVAGCEDCTSSLFHPVARCTGLDTPRQHGTGDFLGVGVQPGLGVREPDTVQVDPELILAHWQAWHMRRGSCVILPCMAYDVECQTATGDEHIFYGRRAAARHLENCHSERDYKAEVTSTVAGGDRPIKMNLSTSLLEDALYCWKRKGLDHGSYLAERYSTTDLKRQFRGMFEPRQKSWSWQNVRLTAIRCARKGSAIKEADVRKQAFTPAEILAMRTWDIAFRQAPCPFKRGHNQRALYWEFDTAVVATYEHANEQKSKKKELLSTAVAEAAPTPSKTRRSSSSQRKKTTPPATATATVTAEPQAEKSKLKEVAGTSEGTPWSVVVGDGRKSRSKNRASAATLESSDKSRGQKRKGSRSASSSVSKRRPAQSPKGGKDPKVLWKELPPPQMAVIKCDLLTQDGKLRMLSIARRAYFKKTIAGELYEYWRTDEMAVAISSLWESLTDEMRKKVKRWIVRKPTNTKARELFGENPQNYVPIKLASVLKYQFERDHKTQREEPKDLKPDLHKLHNGTSRRILHLKLIWCIHLATSTQYWRRQLENELDAGKECVPEDGQTPYGARTSHSETESEKRKSAAKANETRQEVKSQDGDETETYYSGDGSRRSSISGVSSAGSTLDCASTLGSQHSEPVQAQQGGKPSTSGPRPEVPVSPTANSIAQPAATPVVTQAQLTAALQTVEHEAMEVTSASPAEDGNSVWAVSGSLEAKSAAARVQQLVESLQKELEGSSNLTPILGGVVTSCTQVQTLTEKFAVDLRRREDEIAALTGRLAASQSATATIQAKNDELKRQLAAKEENEISLKLTIADRENKLRETVKGLGQQNAPKRLVSMSEVVKTPPGTDPDVDKQAAQNSMALARAQIRNVTVERDVLKGEVARLTRQVANIQTAMNARRDIIVKAGTELGQWEMVQDPSLRPTSYAADNSATERSARTLVAVRCKSLVEQFLCEVTDAEKGGLLRPGAQSAQGTVDMLRRWSSDISSLLIYVLDLGRAVWGSDKKPPRVTGEALRNSPKCTVAKLTLVKNGEVKQRLVSHRREITAAISNGVANEILVVPDEDGNIHESVNQALQSLQERVAEVERQACTNHTNVLHNLETGVANVLASLREQRVTAAASCDKPLDGNNNEVRSLSAAGTGVAAVGVSSAVSSADPGTQSQGGQTYSTPVQRVQPNVAATGVGTGGATACCGTPRAGSGNIPQVLPPSVGTSRKLTICQRLRNAAATKVPPQKAKQLREQDQARANRRKTTVKGQAVAALRHQRQLDKEAEAVTKSKREDARSSYETSLTEAKQQLNDVQSQGRQLADRMEPDIAQLADSMSRIGCAITRDNLNPTPDESAAVIHDRVVRTTDTLDLLEAQYQTAYGANQTIEANQREQVRVKLEKELVHAHPKETISLCEDRLLQGDQIPIGMDQWRLLNPDGGNAVLIQPTNEGSANQSSTVPPDSETPMEIEVAGGNGSVSPLPQDPPAEQVLVASGGSVSPPQPEQSIDPVTIVPETVNNDSDGKESPSAGSSATDPPPAVLHSDPVPSPKRPDDVEDGVSDDSDL